jgi:hypothetical protein
VSEVDGLTWSRSAVRGRHPDPHSAPPGESLAREGISDLRQAEVAGLARFNSKQNKELVGLVGLVGLIGLLD